MEPLFLAVICGCNAGLYREALHKIYIPRIQQGDALFAANILGARGALLLVLAHFFENGQWGSFVETAVEQQSLTAEDQLLVLMQAGQYLRATRGFAAREALICYERAERLCHSLNHPLVLSVALTGQWRYSLNTDTLTATMQIAGRIYSLAQEQNDSVLMIGAYCALAMTHYFAGDFETFGQYAMRAVRLWRSRDVQFLREELDMLGITCLCYEALYLWHLGEIALCQATIAEAISMAKELKDMHGLAVALYWAARLYLSERNFSEGERLTSELIEVSTRQNFPHWLALGTALRGWTRVASGDIKEGLAWIEGGIRDWVGTGAVLQLPYYLGLKSEALHLANRTSEALATISEAEALVERLEDRHWCAELHRLRGVFLAALGSDEAQIEASFSAAIRTGKGQKSITLAARAEATHAEYRRQKASGSGGRGFRLPLW